MDYILKIVNDILEDMGQSAEEKLQVNIICEQEKEFFKGLSKEQWNKYFDLEAQKGLQHDIIIENAIKTTIAVCKKIFLDK